MNKGRFIVAIPSLNAAETIGFTLESLRALRIAGVEIVVADSFSTDGTIDIIKNWGHAKLVSIERGNMYSAVNHALRSVGGWDWATYINADDLLYPDQTLKLLAGLSENLDIAYGNIDYIDACGRFLHAFRSPSIGHLKGIFASGINPIPQQGTWFSRRIYDLNSGFDTKFRYSADFDFFLRAVVRNAKFAKHLSSTVAAFRIHEKQLSQQFKADMLLEARESLGANQIPVTRISKTFSRTVFRARNIDQYMIRYIRHWQVTGRVKFPTTMSG
jgi:glycosyltransferase